jgi:hypothetical protein
MNAPTHRYSLRIASKAGSCNESVTHSDTQSVISAPSPVGVRTRRSCGATKARRSARLAKLPRVCYAGMDEE